MPVLRGEPRFAATQLAAAKQIGSFAAAVEPSAGAAGKPRVFDAPIKVGLERIDELVNRGRVVRLANRDALCLSHRRRERLLVEVAADGQDDQLVKRDRIL